MEHDLLVRGGPVVAAWGSPGTDFEKFGSSTTCRLAVTAKYLLRNIAA